MKWVSNSLNLLLLVCLGSIVNAQEKFPLVGYATLNGGTIGGAGGTETTVTTSAAFIAAVKVSLLDPVGGTSWRSNSSAAITRETLKKPSTSKSRSNSPRGPKSAATPQ